jgi:hypothetical protein
MAQGHQICRALGTHDARDPGDALYVPLLVPATLDQLQGLRVHSDPPLGDRYTMGNGLGRHIHHVGLAGSVEMSQLGHRVKNW